VSQIKALNKTEQAIVGASHTLGRQAAGDMYNNGKLAGKGFYKGLEEQQRHIEQMMRKIARSMVEVIRRELGIHSPSEVARWHGQMFAEGLAKGIDDSSGKVKAAAKRLAGATGLGAGGVIAGGGGGDVHVTNHFEFHVTAPNGFIGSQAQFAAELAPGIQKAILQQQHRNPIPQAAAA